MEEINLQTTAVDEQFRITADSAPVLIWLTGVDKLCYFFNAAWLSFRGRTMEQECGNGWAAGVHPDDIAHCMDAYNESFDNRTLFKMEYRLLRHDGVYRWMLDTGVPRYTADGVFAGYIGSCVDIHEMKQAQETLRQLNGELEEMVAQRTRELQQINEELQLSNAEMEHFAYAASHDIKEPIRKIIFFIDMIERAPAQLGKYLPKIKTAAARMNQLTDNLLELSTVNQHHEWFEPVYLDHTLQQVKQDLELLLAQHSGAITAPALPVVAGIPQQMQQLFYNLISNALKYTRPGVKPQVTITATERDITIEEAAALHLLPGLYIQLQFADNGIGFQQEHAEKIFAPFARLHSKDEYAGTGMGLAICKKVVLKHGGAIAAAGELGKGAVFTVLLPQQQHW